MTLFRKGNIYLYDDGVNRYNFEGNVMIKGYLTANDFARLWGLLPDAYVFYVVKDASQEQKKWEGSGLSLKRWIGRKMDESKAGNTGIGGISGDSKNVEISCYSRRSRQQFKELKRIGQEQDSHDR